MAVDLKEMFSRLAFEHSREYVIASQHTDPAYIAYNCGYHARRIMELAQALEGQLNTEAWCQRYDRDPAPFHLMREHDLCSRYDHDEAIFNAGYDLK